VKSGGHDGIENITLLDFAMAAQASDFFLAFDLDTSSKKSESHS